MAATTLRLHEIVVLSKCTAQITLNLRNWVLIRLHIDQAFVGFLHFLVLFCRVVLQRLGARVDLFVPLARFLAEHWVGRIFGTVANAAISANRWRIELEIIDILSLCQAVLVVLGWNSRWIILLDRNYRIRGDFSGGLRISRGILLRLDDHCVGRSSFSWLNWDHSFLWRKNPTDALYQVVKHTIWLSYHSLILSRILIKFRCTVVLVFFEILVRLNHSSWSYLLKIACRAYKCLHHLTFPFFIWSSILSCQVFWCGGLHHHLSIWLLND